MTLPKRNRRNAHVNGGHYGEGWVDIQWEDDPIYGSEGLRIGFAGHCSRNMPIRSGQGSLDFANLTRETIRLRFGPELAEQLELPQELVIRFELDDEGFAALSRAVDFFRGDYFRAKSCGGPR